MKNLMACLLVLFSMNSFAHIECKTSNEDLIFLTKNINAEGFTVTINWEVKEIPAIVKFGNSIKHILSTKDDSVKITYSIPTGLGTGKINGELVMVECLKKSLQ